LKNLSDDWVAHSGFFGPLLLPNTPSLPQALRNKPIRQRKIDILKKDIKKPLILGGVIEGFTGNTAAFPYGDLGGRMRQISPMGPR